jgi:hypothetical protein
VERRLTIRSNPSNALVILDGQEIGFTPVSVPFTYYGAREIKLVKDGYETRVIRQRVAPPWYQLPGIDFVAESLVPVRLRDDRDYGGDVYTLEPKAAVPQEQLVARANEVRALAANPPERALRRAKVESFPPDPGALGAIELAHPAPSTGSLGAGGTAAGPATPPTELALPPPTAPAVLPPADPLAPAPLPDAAPAPRPPADAEAGAGPLVIPPAQPLR